MLTYQLIYDRLQAEKAQDVLSRINLEKCIYLTHLTMYRAWKEDTYKYGGWVELPSKMLKKKLGGDYKDIVTYLKNLHIIEGRDSYSNKGKTFSKCYRIHSDYFQQSPMIYVKATTNIITKLFTKPSRAEQEAKIKESSVEVQKMFGNYTSLSIDINRIHTLIHQMVTPSKNLSLHDTQMMYHFTADQLYMQQPYATCTTDEYGRVHYPLTYNPALFRNGCSYNGSTLVELDISNSQLLPLCLLLLNSEFSEDEDVIDFIGKTQDGIIYNHLMEHLGFDKSQRGEFKDCLFEILYGKLWTMRRSKYYKRVKALYPQVLQFIENYKVLDHKKLPLDMMRKESEIMIHSRHGVLSQLIQRKIYCVTIHDSVAVQEADVKQAEEIIHNAFAHFGLRCHVKQNPWT